MHIKLIKVLFGVIMKLVSWGVSYKLSQRFNVVLDLIYTMWIRNFIGEVGKDVSFQKPLRLQGGGSRRIRIGDCTSIQSHSILGCWQEYGNQHFEPSISIGNHCCIGEYNHITACNRIIIGDGLLTGRYVYIGDNSHGGLSVEEASVPPAKRALKSKGEIKIGNNVWIGDKVTILGNVTIGDNVIIGANSVVTHDLPSNCVAAGNPVKIVKRLNDDRKS